MVAVIHTSSSISRTLNYNEQKVKESQAKCIAAVNYPKDCDKLNFFQKLNRLQRQAALNENVTRNSVHISLNFDVSEKLPEGTLKEIAASYMDKIGFGEQPYLVYQHTDAGHPHIHIVSVKIRADGRRIDTQNIGRNQSSKARREIEKEFGLVRADERKQKEVFELKPVNTQKIIYGKTATKRAITNVLDVVIGQYSFTSLPELNAILKLYNVTADRGAADSRIFKNNGLVYRVLDDKGNKTGVPIKASDIYSKPTLKLLEPKFKANETLRESYKKHIKQTIDWLLLKKATMQLPELMNLLQKEKISTVLRQNEQGLIYGITFIDHQHKTVFNGSDLGKQYSAKAILEKCSGDIQQITGSIIKEKASKKVIISSSPKTNPTEYGSGITALLSEIIAPENTFTNTPYQFRKKKRKRTNRKT